MPKTNETTVVGVFDDYATAHQAAYELQSEGVSPMAIQIQSESEDRGGPLRQSEAAADGGGIKGFFRRLLGTDDFGDERGLYAQAVRRGRSIVVVTTSKDQVNRLVELLNDLGAADIDCHAEFFR